MIARLIDPICAASATVSQPWQRADRTVFSMGKANEREQARIAPLLEV